VYKHVVGDIYKFNNQQGLVKLGLSKVGTLEVQKLGLDGLGNRVIDALPFT
jgi:hypothetical protein